jgi:hypothetical protein
VPIVGTCYGALYSVLFAFAWGIGEGAEQPQGIWAILATILGVLVNILGFPFMKMLSTAWGIKLSRQVFGDDAQVVFGLIFLNSLLWSIVLVALFQYVRDHRKRAA